MAFSSVTKRLAVRSPGASSVCGRRRHVDEARHLRRHRDERVERAAVGFALQFERDGEAEVGDERERVRGIDGQRRQAAETPPS